MFKIRDLLINVLGAKVGSVAQPTPTEPTPPSPLEPTAGQDVRE